MRIQFVALDASGHRHRGTVEGEGLPAAHRELLARGLSPMTLRPANDRSDGSRPQTPALKSRELSEFLDDLGVLVSAGVGLPEALSLVGAKGRTRAIRDAAKAIGASVKSGAPLDRAFAGALGDRARTTSSLIAAGEAVGDLGGAIRAGAEDLAQRLKLSESIIAALAYPGFIAVMSMASLFIILIYVLPALAPILDASAGKLPLTMQLMFAVSRGLSEHLGAIVFIGCAIIGLTVVAVRLRLLIEPLNKLILDGPLKQISRALIFGDRATVLGLSITARVPAHDALNLVIGGARMGLVRERLTRVSGRVQEGIAVSEALSECPGMPLSIIRLAAIGEETGALGPLLEKAGRLERDKGLRQLEQMSRWLSPALIVALGIIIGALMGGLLSSVTALGDIATN